MGGSAVVLLLVLLVLLLVLHGQSLVTMCVAGFWVGLKKERKALLAVSDS
eukprot:SAG31_NODE_36089_length_316_cov_1.294931_1_plen_49_part_01